MKMSNINVNLDIMNPKTLKKLVKALEGLEDDLNKTSNDILKEITDDGLDFLKKQYNTSPNRDDPNIDFESIDVSKKEVEKGWWQLIAKGDDVLYEEYGTGDEGQASPHPNKTASGLNPYNSGPTIREADDVSAFYGITSGKYWTYKKDGKRYITNGIPAGKEMWNTRNYLRKKMSKVAKKRGEEIRDKFVNTIKE